MRSDLIVDVLGARAQRQGDLAALTFLAGCRPPAVVTYGALDASARAIAVSLGKVAQPRQRVLLLFPPGLDFAAALLGTFYAGMIAVPAALPEPGRLQRTVPRLQSIAGDAQTAAVLTTSACLPLLQGILEAPALTVDGIDIASGAAWRRPADFGPDDLAFLQYTSGSTASPKGAMITHAALMKGASYLSEAWAYGTDSRSLIWVPDSHDDGLMQGNILPILAGFPCWRMSPLEIVQSPFSWLEAISRHRITHSGGPNFAYELCLRKIGAEERKSLALGSWRMAYNAAEPVRASTLRRFSETFAECGFSPRSHFPSYGLAEATLLVTTRPKDELPSVLNVEIEALESAGRVALQAAEGPGTRSLVSCGAPVCETRVDIADPATLEPLGEDRVGEVLVSTPSLAAGYWNLPEISGSTFICGYGEDPGRSLRTGDLGFLHAGELYITGRLKDMIVIRGRNLYPQDLELTVERSDRAFRPGCGAAFAIEHDDEEQIVFVQEVAANLGSARLAELSRKIFQELAEEHDVRPYAVALIPPQTLEKTASGKIQRGACREAFLHDRFEILERRFGKGGGKADAMIEWLRSWSESRLDSRLMDERRSMSPHVVLDLGNQGFFGLTASRAHGGLGLGARDLVRVLEQLGAIDLTLASFVLGQNLLGVSPIERHASERTRREVLPGLTAGRYLSALALTESAAGANPRAITAVGLWDGASGTWRLEGEKTWSGTAGWAEVISVFVKVDGGPEGESGITAFVLRRGSHGLRVGSEMPTLGLRGMVQNTVHLEGVSVSPDDLLGPPGAGTRVAQETLSLARLGLGAVAVGGMKRCAQLMQRYAGRRTIATGRLLENPVLLARLDELGSAITALECLVASCARRLDQGRALPLDAAITCKIAGAEMLWRAADDLVQTLGARGCSEANVASQILRDARLLRIFEGPTEALLAHLGSRAAIAEPELFAWLHERDPEGEAIVRRAITDREAYAPRSGTGPGVAQRRQWLCHHLGALVHWAILQAAVFEAVALRGATEPLARASSWLAERIGQAGETLGERSSFDEVLRGAGRVTAMIDSYQDAIGNLDQARTEEDRCLDPLLRKEMGGATDSMPRTTPPFASTGGNGSAPGKPEEAERRDYVIEAWLTDWLALHLELPRDMVTADAPLSTFVDSVIAVMMMGDLGTWLGAPLDPALPWAHPTIEALSRELAGTRT